MKWMAVLLAAMLAGCLGGDEAGQQPTESQTAPCPWEGEQTLYLHDLDLARTLPASGSTPGNGFNEAFLSDDMDEWRHTVGQDFVIDGNVSLHYWARGNGMPAPIVITGGPTEGYHFFNQFGTSRGFVESFVVVNEPIVGDGEVREYQHTFAMPVGGLRVEAGDDLRLLLTNLVADDAAGAGPDILWGGDTPSAIQFTSRCVDSTVWSPLAEAATPVAIPLHHGLLTGAVPATEDVNFVDVPFRLDPTTERLTITMQQTGGPNPLKDDMDIAVLDATGQQVWSIGSPYSDEIGTLHGANLAAMMPPGAYTVRVNSYSGHGYEGRITITQDAA